MGSLRQSAGAPRPGLHLGLYTWVTAVPSPPSIEHGHADSDAPMNTTSCTTLTHDETHWFHRPEMRRIQSLPLPTLAPADCTRLLTTFRTPPSRPFTLSTLQLPPPITPCPLFQPTIGRSPAPSSHHRSEPHGQYLSAGAFRWLAIAVSDQDPAAWQGSVYSSDALSCFVARHRKAAPASVTSPTLPSNPHPPPSLRQHTPLLCLRLLMSDFPYS